MVLKKDQPLKTGCETIILQMIRLAACFCLFVLFFIKLMCLTNKIPCSDFGKITYLTNLMKLSQKQYVLIHYIALRKMDCKLELEMLTTTDSSF